MNRPWIVVALLGLLLMTACKGKSSAEHRSVEGQYAGQGKFTAAAGSMEINATLDIKPGGQYVLRLKELGGLGNEVGQWSLAGTELTLTPSADDTAKMGGGKTMRAMAANKQPKVLSVAAGFREVTLADGPMQVTMQRQ
ncbi:MAG TPA: hypothetical protein PLH94_06145 [Fimbriimonadaceae bacterium]|nr:hypothetical protein [Fimbriimonadaceae bacterium]